MADEKLKITADAAGNLTANQRLWETKDGRAVVDGDPAAFRLFATPGQPIAAAEAARVGLTEKGVGEKPAKATGEIPSSETPAPVQAEEEPAAGKRGKVLSTDSIEKREA